MVRKLLILLLLCTPFTTYAQDDDPLSGYLSLQEKGGEFYFEEVMAVEGIKKKELHFRGKQWFIDNYKSAADVLHLDDYDNGALIGKSWKDISLNPDAVNKKKVRVNYTVSIYFRDGRYKFVISEIMYSTYPSDPYGVRTFLPETIFSDENYYKKNGKPRKKNKRTLDATVLAFTEMANDVQRKMLAGSTGYTLSADNW